MAKKNNADKLTETGPYEKNYYRAMQKDSKSFWDKVDTADHALQKSQSMAASYYGDKANKVKSSEDAYDTMGDFPTSKSIKHSAAAAKRLKARVLKDSGEGRKRLIESYKTRGYAKGGSVSSASKRADGCATKGKTKGRFV